MSSDEGRINPQVTDSYVTNGGVRVTRTIVSIPVQGAIEPVIDALDARRGVVLASSYEYPGRYTRWDMGFVDPPLELRGSRPLVHDPRAERPRAGARPRDRARAVPPRRHRVAAAGTTRCSRAPSPSRRGASPRSSAAASRRCSRSCARSSTCSARTTTRTSACTAPSATTSSSSSSRCVLRLERPDDQRDLVLYLPDEIVVVDHRREVAERRLYDFETPTGVDRRHRAHRPARSLRGRRRASSATATTSRASTRRSSRSRARRSSAATCSRSSPSRTFFEACPASAVRGLLAAARAQPVPVRLPHQPRAARVPRRRVAGDVRARRRRPRRDVSDRRDDRARRRPDRRRRADPDDPELREGRVRADDVHRRRPQRQGAHLRPRLGARDRTAADRDVLAADPHRRPRRGAAASRASTRSTRSSRTRGPSPSPARRRSGRCSSSRTTSGRRARGTAAPSASSASTATSTPGSRCGRSGSRTASPRSAPARRCSTTRTRTRRRRRRRSRRRRSSTRSGVRASAARASRRPATSGRRRASASCSSTTRTRSSTRSPTTSARRGPRSSTLRAGFPHDRARRPSRPTSSCCRRARDAVRLRRLRARSARPSSAGCRVFGVCLGLQGIVEHFGGELGVLDYPMHGKPSRDHAYRRRLFEGFPAEFAAGRYHSLFALPSRCRPSCA